MAEAARALKANPKLAGQPCGWCGEAVALGADVRVCTTCEGLHHAACWDSSAGCSKAGCLNAPLQKLDDAAAPGVAAEALPAGFVRCPMCRHVVMEADGLCSRCQAPLSPDGVYHGPQVTAPGAVASVVWGVIGLFFFGFILGAVAIGKAQSARGLIRTSPKYSGGALAMTGLVLGCVDIVGWIIVLGMRCSR